MAGTRTSINATITANASQFNTSIGAAVMNVKRFGQEARRAGQGVSGSGGLAGGMLQVSQFADDAQYGLRSVVNQIPLLLMSFGAGAGLAGAVQLAAVAVNLLSKAWTGETEAAEAAAEQARMAALGQKLIADATTTATAAIKEQEERLTAVKELYQQGRTVIERNTALMRMDVEATLAVARAHAEAKERTEDRIKAVSELAKTELESGLGVRSGNIGAKEAANKDAQAKAQKVIAEATQTVALEEARVTAEKKKQADWENRLSQRLARGFAGTDKETEAKNQIKFFGDSAAAAQKMVDAAKKDIETQKGWLKELADEEREIREERVLADKEQITLGKKKQEIDIRRNAELRKLQKEDASSWAKKSKQLDREAEHWAKEAGARELQRKDENAYLEILKLKQFGLKKLADEKERELNLTKRARQLEQEGFDPETAMKKAKEERSLTEGRRKGDPPKVLTGPQGNTEANLMKRFGRLSKVDQAKAGSFENFAAGQRGGKPTFSGLDAFDKMQDRDRPLGGLQKSNRAAARERESGKRGGKEQVPQAGSEGSFSGFLNTALTTIKSIDAGVKALQAGTKPMDSK